MIARKENKEYTVDDNTKAIYLNDGYDIYDDKGKLIEYSPKKQVPIASYLELEKQVKELTAKLEEVNADTSNDKELVKANKVLEKKVKELTAANASLEEQVNQLKSQGDSHDQV